MTSEDSLSTNFGEVQLAEQAQTALALVQRWTTDNGLTLHPEKTWIVNVDA